jgi:FlaG/FlaF family flagellin (archaellin)
MCNGPGTIETMRILVVLAAVVAAGAIGTTRASATTTADRQAQLSQLRGDTVAGSLRMRRASLAGTKSGIRAVSQC